MISPDDKLREECFRLLDPDFIDNIKIAQLMFEEPFLGLLVTKNDDVYKISNGCYDDFQKNYFGLSPRLQETELSYVEALCGKKISSFSAGSDHILALSETGSVYAWGCNEHCELGQGTNSDSDVPILVTGCLTDQVVRQVEAGAESSYALTEEGKIFSWGSNKDGRTGHGALVGCTKTPKLVEMPFALRKSIITIRSTCRSLVCLSKRGKLVAFGYGEDGQLGNGERKTCLTPVKVKIPDTEWIQDVWCGDDHTLAVTNDGKLYAWGLNDVGQIGDGGSKSCLIPKAIYLPDDDFEFLNEEIFGPSEVMGIWAEGNTSYAVKTTADVYVWGCFNNTKIHRGMKINIHRLPGPTIQLSPSKFGAVANDIRGLFDDKSSADLIINVEGKDLHVHKLILQCRSRYFKSMFNSDWKECQEGKIVVENFQYSVYTQLIRYLYGAWQPSMHIEETMKLLELAEYVLDDRLIRLCVERIKTSLGSLGYSAVATVFSSCVSANQEELADYCVRFAMRNLDTVLDSEAFEQISSDHFREFFLRCRKYGSFVVANAKR